jgi:uncharacterized membrane protein YphA (DoxX/SURF4 family)
MAHSSSLAGGLGLTLRFALGFVFLLAAIPKLRSRREFAQAVSSYQLVPLSRVDLVATWLPRLELLCAFALLVGVFVTPVGIAAAALLFSFAGAVAVNLLRGREIDCGCNGAVAPRRIGWGLAVADVFMACAALFVAVVNPRVLSVVSIGTRPTSLTSGEGLALVFVGALVVVAQILAFAARRVTRTAGELDALVSEGVFS